MGKTSHAMDGTALVICDGYFDTPVGKTAHGLVRGTDRYRVVGVIDGANAGRDGGDRDPQWEGLRHDDARARREGR